MDYNRIRKLIRLVEESDISLERYRTFFGIKLYGFGITKTRTSKKTIEQKVEVLGVQEAIPVAEYPICYEIKSEMVGTYYRNERKTRKPLVREGRRVEAGQVLCYIEALKLMNPVISDYTGIVRTVLVRKNKQPVEFGQPLFEIERTQEQ